MSTYHIDSQASKTDDVMLVKLSGRAQAETIVKLLGELNAVTERDSSLHVLIDETDLGAGFVGPSDIGRIAQAWQKAGLNRMFQGLADGAEWVSVLGDRARARAWLLEG